MLIKRILVPVDGSEQSDKALDFALDLAEKYSAKIEILSVVSHETSYMPILFGGAGVPPTPASADWLNAYIEERKTSHENVLLQSLKKAKIYPSLDVSTRLVEGRAAEKIVEITKKEAFDLIVMGSRGLGGVKEFLLGSVSDRVADKAECPVLIVK
jgi:nucleotide-binding universal stress UspA family protein